MTPVLLAARRMLFDVFFFQQTELTNCDGSSSAVSSPYIDRNKVKSKSVVCIINNISNLKN